MTKTELVDQMAQDAGIPKVAAAAALESLIVSVAWYVKLSMPWESSVGV